MARVTPSDASLATLFRGIVWAVAAATAGCESGATPAVATAHDAGDLSDLGDVSVAVDAGSCVTSHEIVGGDADCPTEATYFPCELPSDLMDATVGKVLDLPYCDRYCTITSTKGGTYCYLQPVDGGMVFQCQIQCIGGRRPEGYRETARGTGLGAWLTQLAELEGASVAAFVRLANELRAHGAPTELVERAERAADDERRHHVMVAGLLPWVPRDESLWLLRLSSPGLRSLVDIALENAVEGCVREAYGALVATWQATHAGDPAIAAVMVPIAADETRHAALSWALHAWLDARLDAAERAAVDAAMADAWRSLQRAVAPAAGDFVAVAGLPTAAQQASLLAMMQSALAA